jgi:hypothetical protein
LAQLARIREISKGNVYPNPGELWVLSQRYSRTWYNKPKDNKRMLDAIFGLLTRPGFEELTNLRLSNVYINSQRSKVLSGLTRLKSAEFYGCWAESSSGSYSPLRLPRVRCVETAVWWGPVDAGSIEHLETYRIDPYRTDSDVHSGPMFTKLKTLTIGSTSYEISTSLRRIVAHAPVLEDLRIMTHHNANWPNMSLADPIPKEVVPPIKRFVGPDYCIGLFGLHNELEDVELWGTTQQWGVGENIEACLSHLVMIAPNIRALRLRIPCWSGDRIVSALSNFTALQYLNINTYVLRNNEDIQDVPLHSRLVCQHCVVS